MKDRSPVTAFWFEFPQSRQLEFRMLIWNGVGVSGPSRQDAMNIVPLEIFKGLALPDDTQVAEGVSLNDLDQKHVVPNCRPLCVRGVWFPMI